MTPEEMQALQAKVAEALRAAGFTDVEAAKVNAPAPAEIFFTHGNEGDAFVLTLDVL